MHSHITQVSINVSHIKSVSDDYDVMIASLGYESRARYLPGLYSRRCKYKLALGFAEQNTGAYISNKKWFQESGFRIEITDDSDFFDISRLALENYQSNRTEPLRILVDISSMSRFRMAALIEVLSIGLHQVDFVYAIANYEPPSEDLEANTYVGYVRPAFAGWSSRPEKAVTAVIGLGYELDRALGAIEHVQAANARYFYPKSPIADYEVSVREANSELIKSAQGKLISYQVLSPYYLYTVLEKLVSQLSIEENVIIFPFGPKIFALCSLLTSFEHPQVAVWRITSGGLADPVDRQASSHECCIRVTFTRKS